MQDLYTENYKTLLRKIKDLSKWREMPCLWIRRLHIGFFVCLFLINFYWSIVALQCCWFLLYSKMNRRLHIVKMSILPKLVYTLKVILIKIPAAFFLVANDKLILKFI